MQDIESDIKNIILRIENIEYNISNIDKTLKEIKNQTSIMENHVVNVEAVIKSTPITTTLFRALNWRFIPRLLYFK